MLQFALKKCLIVLCLLLSVVPAFRIHNIGGSLEPKAASQISYAPDIRIYDDGAYVTEITGNKPVEYKTVNYLMVTAKVIEEDAKEFNPETKTGLYTLPQLLVRIRKDKDLPRPYRIKRVALF